MNTYIQIIIFQNFPKKSSKTKIVQNQNIIHACVISHFNEIGHLNNFFNNSFSYFVLF